MAVLRSRDPQARGLVAVDPLTGWVIPHCLALDAEKGWLETYRIQVCHPSAPLVLRHPDGSAEERPYRFTQTRDGLGARPQYATVTHWVAFDVVRLATGEVVAEARPRDYLLGCEELPETPGYPWGILEVCDDAYRLSPLGLRLRQDQADAVP